jgi:hypothetical protein
MSINRGPFTALIDDDGSNATGSIWNKTAIKNVLLDPIDALPAVTGQWSTYAPVWSGGGGTPPTLGNGILSGRYLQLGHWIEVAIVLKTGTTTTYGVSSYWTFSLPFAPLLVAQVQEVFLHGAPTAASGASYPGATAYYIGGASPAVLLVLPSGSLVNEITPFTWSTGAALAVRGSYELP